jgi:hypothetical protein
VTKALVDQAELSHVLSDFVIHYPKSPSSRFLWNRPRIASLDIERNLTKRMFSSGAEIGLAYIIQGQLSLVEDTYRSTVEHCQR